MDFILVNWLRSLTLAVYIRCNFTRTHFGLETECCSDYNTIPSQLMPVSMLLAK